jgi:hypothetical protein
MLASENLNRRQKEYSIEFHRVRKDHNKRVYYYELYSHFSNIIITFILPVKIIGNHICIVVWMYLMNKCVILCHIFVVCINHCLFAVVNWEKREGREKCRRGLDNRFFSVYIFVYPTRSHHHDVQVNNRLSLSFVCLVVSFADCSFYLYDKYSSQRITFDKVQRLVSFLSHRLTFVLSARKKKRDNWSTILFSDFFPLSLSL